MNKERIYQLADLLDKHHEQELGFFMGNYFLRSIDDEHPVDFQEKECDSVGCIAGWTVFHFGDKEKLYQEYGTDYRQIDIVDEAKNLLGLTGYEALMLFEPDELFYHVSMGDSVTAQEAALTLRHFAGTGEINWTHVIERYEQQGDD